MRTSGDVWNLLLLFTNSLRFLAQLGRLLLFAFFRSIHLIRAQSSRNVFGKLLGSRRLLRIRSEDYSEVTLKLSSSHSEVTPKPPVSKFEPPIISPVLFGKFRSEQ